MVRITTIIDNYPDINHPEWVAEHGLSFLIEYEGTRILCDTGASPAFWENAEKMGIDLRTLSYAFLSHGHSDHTGGLRTFLEKNHHAQVYLSSCVFDQKFFSSRRGSKRDISTDWLLKSEYESRLKGLTDSCWLIPGVALVRTYMHPHACPKGNLFLTCSERDRESLDTFKHEYALALSTSEGLVIVSSCSHNGAVNIMDACCRFTQVGHVKAFVGGLHLVDSNQVGDEVATFLADKENSYPETIFYTGHCTGSQAREYLNHQKNIHFFYTGRVMDF